MRIVCSSVMLLSVLSPVLAQEQPHVPVPMKGEGPQSVTVPPAPPMPQFESLAKKGPDGKVMPLEGVMDILAFQRNKLIDASTIERVRQAVAGWLADVDQLAIDNLDFIEMLEPEPGKKGMLDNVNVEDKVQLSTMAQMMNQLMSAGPLTAHLENKGLITREQSGLNQTITGEYLQRRMDEINAEQPPAELAGNDEAIKAWRINKLTSFLYQISCKDPISSYRRMVNDAAFHIDDILKGMKLDGERATKVAEAVPAVKAATDVAGRRVAVRNLLKHLTFAQKREFLTRARDAAPVTDPLAPPAS